MSSQVQLFSTPLSILSIPAQHYQHFFHGIVKLLTNTWHDDLRPNSRSSSSSIFKANERSFSRPSTASSQVSIDSTKTSNRSSDDEHNDDDDDETAVSDKIEALQEFINVSFTPVECSVICPTELVGILFGKALDQASIFSKSTFSGKPKALQGQYLAIQVDGDGADSGSRILEITAPLSSAGIPIFFIPTYFSDYVLVPSHAQSAVSTALESYGFVFSNTANSYVTQKQDQPPPPQQQQEQEQEQTVPLSPYLSSLGDQTFDKFMAHGVRPTIDVHTKLLLTGARTSPRTAAAAASSALHASSTMYLAIVETLINPPDYFSVTVVDGGAEVSFIINEETVSAFPSDLLLGSPTDFVIPITFDLSSLPEDSTGIVAGVASRLLKKSPGELMQMSYLSTAKTGVVMIPAEDLNTAKEALRGYL